MNERIGRKEVGDVVDWLVEAAGRTGLLLSTYRTSDGHIGFKDVATDEPILRVDGSVLAISSTPSARGWKQSAVREFFKLGLIPELHVNKRRSMAKRDYQDWLRMRAKRQEAWGRVRAIDKRLARFEHENMHIEEAA